MKPLGNVMTHFRLLSRMARAAGLDLRKATEGGVLDQAEWAAMVDSCRRCGWAGRCAAWLDRHDATGAVPEPCRNRARMALLRARMAQPATA